MNDLGTTRTPGMERCGGEQERERSRSRDREEVLSERMDEVVDVMEIMTSMCDNREECMCYEFDIDTSKKRKRFLQNP